VTRLGEFSPFGRLFTLAFFKIQLSSLVNLGPTIFHYKRFLLKRTKYGLDFILGHFLQGFGGFEIPYPRYQRCINPGTQLHICIRWCRWETPSKSQNMIFSRKVLLIRSNKDGNFLCIFILFLKNAKFLRIEPFLNDYSKEMLTTCHFFCLFLSTRVKSVLRVKSHSFWVRHFNYVSQYSQWIVPPTESDK
jgi:hypothetical protein